MRIALILQATVLTLLSLASFWWAYWQGQGRTVLAFAGALTILLSHSFPLAAESLLLALVNRKDASVPPATAWQRLRGFLVEAALMPVVFYGRQAFRRQAVPDMPRGLPGSSRRGVVLVHGFHCNRGFWNPWMRRFRAEGIPCIAVDLDPPFRSLDDYVEIVDAAVRTLECNTGRLPVVVAHSMGGLAVRAWLCARDGEGGAHRILTIGTPHRGTWLSRFARSHARLQMTPDCEWLTSLARREPPVRYASFTCFWSHCDNVVFPASTATLSGADNRHVEAAAHVEMIYRAEVFDEVMRWLESGSSEAGETG